MRLMFIMSFMLYVFGRSGIETKLNPIIGISEGSQLEG